MLRFSLCHFRCLSLAALFLAVGTPLASAQARTDGPEFALAFAELPDAPLPQQNQAPQQNQTPANETDSQRRTRQQSQSDTEVQQAGKQRIAGVMPGFNVVMDGHAAPITAKQKFGIAFHTLRDPYYIGVAGLSAGWSELRGTHKGYGWGPEGYFKRMGAAYADNADGTLIGNAILPSLLHQDPRYYRKGKGRFVARVLNAALFAVVCHGDNGKLQPNYSNIGGNFASGAISNLYYPDDERGVSLALENGATVTAYGILSAQLLEFGPDIGSLFHHKKN